MAIFKLIGSGAVANLISFRFPLTVLWSATRYTRMWDLLGHGQFNEYKKYSLVISLMFKARIFTHTECFINEMH